MFYYVAIQSVYDVFYVCVFIYLGFHYFYRQCGLEIYTQPAQNSMRGPATAPQKKYQARDRPASENLIQARASPRAAGARGPRGAGQPMQGFSIDVSQMICMYYDCMYVSTRREYWEYGICIMYACIICMYVQHLRCFTCI